MSTINVKVGDSLDPVTVDVLKAADGATWLSTTGIPDNGIGKNGDRALDASDGQVYLKDAGVWSFELNIVGADGEGLPVGGTAGQVPTKLSGTDFDIAWVDPSDGSTNLSIAVRTATTLDVVSGTGTDATVPAVSITEAGLMVAADKVRLDGIEDAATADQTGAEIKTAYENEADTNAFDDASETKLVGLKGSSDIETLTNKSIDADNNTITNIGYAEVDADLRDYLEVGNGLALNQPDVIVSSDGATITLSLEQNGGGDIRFIFSTGVYVFDCTPTATVTLTEGSDSVPLLNYIYILESTKTLLSSTVGWPSVEHVPIASAFCMSAASAQVQGSFKMHAWTSHSRNGDGKGHAVHVDFWIRHQPATWISGGVLSPTAGVGQCDIATAAASVLQLHPHGFPAFNTATGSDLYVVNEPTTPYKKVGDLLLSSIPEDANGDALGTANTDFYNLVIWGAVSEDDSDCKLFVNLPDGAYNSNAGDKATNDEDNTAIYTVPPDFTGVGFLIARLTVQEAGGTYTILQNDSLRGLFPGTAAGGGVTGPAGPGLPAGGTAGQRVEKIDGVDYNTQWVDAIADASVTKPKIAEGVLDSASVRPAAYGGGDAGGIGRYANHSYAPTDVSGFDFELECIFSSTVAASGRTWFCGRASTNYAVIAIEPDGTINIIHNTTIIASLAAAYPYDGSLSHVRTRITDTTADLIIDGVTVAAETFAAIAWTSVPSTHSLGSNSTTGPRWPGTIHNVKFTDNKTPANSAFFRMDEIEGDFINTYPGSTVGNATRNGLVLAANVLDEDGGSLPVLSKAVYLHGGANTANQFILGAEKRLQLGVIGVNESGGLNAADDAIFTAPGPGTVEVTATFSMGVNANPANSSNLRVRVAGTVITAMAVEIGATPTRSNVGIASAFLVAEGDDVEIYFANVLATTNTAQANTFNLVLRFYPDPQ